MCVYSTNSALSVKDMLHWKFSPWLFFLASFKPQANSEKCQQWIFFSNTHQMVTLLLLSVADLGHLWCKIRYWHFKKFTFHSIFSLWRWIPAAIYSNSWSLSWSRDREVSKKINFKWKLPRVTFVTEQWLWPMIYFPKVHPRLGCTDLTRSILALVADWVSGVMWPIHIKCRFFMFLYDKPLAR